MLEKAISKIKVEMDQNKNNTYIQVIGDYLLRYVNDNPDAAEKIADPDKTIAKSLNEMRKAAEKKKVNNCAVLTDHEGFALVLGYFGVVPAVILNSIKPDDNCISVTPTKDIKNDKQFEIKLEDLL